MEKIYTKKYCICYLYIIIEYVQYGFFFCIFQIQHDDGKTATTIVYFCPVLFSFSSSSFLKIITITYYNYNCSIIYNKRQEAGS